MTMADKYSYRVCYWEPIGDISPLVFEEHYYKCLKSAAKRAMKMIKDRKLFPKFKNQVDIQVFNLSKGQHYGTACTMLYYKDYSKISGE